MNNHSFIREDADAEDINVVEEILAKLPAVRMPDPIGGPVLQDEETMRDGLCTYPF